MNVPRRGIGDVTRTRLLDWAAQIGETPLAAAAHALDADALPTAGANALVRFARLIERFRGLARHLGVGELLEKLLDEIGMEEALAAEGPDGEERIENVRELLAGAYEFDEQEAGMGPDEDVDVPDATPLDAFLQKVALVTDIDRHDPDADAVTLMTLHNAKGLEFPVVFMSGLEDGLFPLAR
ncbi:MAG: ATP-dependent DNA helicase PcrA, partial [Gemmatimonadetes bacterium]|nr:ATP-dependent DNA helicase PcrA [Gemmatimonadota bacterium]NIX45777.1 ATP-dependent DNA helicase PcrA [Gemmatimonadota bacterium]